MRRQGERWAEWIKTQPVGNTLLPEKLYGYVQAKIASGEYATPTEVVVEALGRLEAFIAAEKAVELEKIAQGLEDMKAGRGRPAEEVFEEMRRMLDG